MTRPCLGTTPCNDATAQLLEKTIKSYEELITKVKAELANKFEDDINFKMNEDLKNKMAYLTKLKNDYNDISLQHEQVSD